MFGLFSRATPPSPAVWEMTEDLGGTEHYQVVKVSTQVKSILHYRKKIRN